MLHALTAIRTGPLEVGLGRALHVRHERVSKRPDACRVVYISDIHLRPGRSETLVRQTLEAARVCQPDLILLGGDLVDRASELRALKELVQSLAHQAPVMAVGGNHDGRVGMDRVEHTVTQGGGQWIHSRTERITHGNRVIAVAGPNSAPPIDGDVRILCAHNPRIWKTSRTSGYHLVLAGHLHGFQLVACQYRDRLFPGAFFYPYCFLSHQAGSTRLVVSRGISDLLPIRWMCPREVVLCHV